MLIIAHNRPCEDTTGHWLLCTAKESIAVTNGDTGDREKGEELEGSQEGY